MILVSKIWKDAQTIFGIRDESLLFDRINDAIELMAIKGEWDPLVGYVDICVDNQCVTLPREIETVLAVNMNGKPSLGRDQLYDFHLNGPGDHVAPALAWIDKGTSCTYRDLRCPAQLVAFLDSSDDNGKEVRVFGYDDQNRPLREQTSTGWRDGYRVPTIFGYALPDANAPKVGRITGVYIGDTVANVRLSSFDGSSTSGTLIGVYEPGEHCPEYRRIKLARAANYITVFYRKRTYEVSSVNDRILLNNRLAIVLAMRAVKFYSDSDIASGNIFEANAQRLLTEKDSSLTGPAGSPIQVNDNAGISSHDDWDIN